jgi:hypothetical protein
VSTMAENEIADVLALGSKETKHAWVNRRSSDCSLVTRVFCISRYHWIHSHPPRRGYSAPRVPFVAR